MGHFIVNLDQGTSQNETSIWSTSVAFHPPQTKRKRQQADKASSTAKEDATKTEDAKASPSPSADKDKDSTLR